MTTKTYPVPLTKEQIEWLLDEFRKWYDDDDDLQDYYTMCDIRTALLAAVGLFTYAVTATGKTTVEIIAPTEAEARAKAQTKLGTQWTIAEVSEQSAE